jgi:hypothetical protein
LAAAAYPLAVALVSAAFAGMVLQQYVARRRPHQLIWAIALLMSALGSGAYVLALPPGSSPTAFRIYYALGGMLMPAWLGLGSIFLAAPRRLADAALAFLVNASALGLGALLVADLDQNQLAVLNGGPGTRLVETGPWLPITILLNTLGVVAVVGVAVHSAIQLARRKGSARLLTANGLIAAGVIIVGIAGSLARTGLPQLFWVTMLAGWIVIFAGFLTASAGSRPGNGLSSRSA